jgi:hypothetical protein
MRMSIDPNNDNELRTAWQEFHAYRRQGECLTEQHLIRLLSGEAGHSEREAAADHLSRCSACAGDYRVLRELKPWTDSATARFDAEGPATASRPGFARHIPSRLSWSGSLAAAAVLALAIGATLYVNQDTAAPAPGRSETPAVVQPAPAAARAPSAFRLEKPPIKLTTATALLYRGAEGVGAQRSDLTRAFDAYRRDDFADAARRLEALTRDDARLAEAHFYLGVSRLFLKQPAAAIDPLLQARRVAPEVFSADAGWYLALAEDASGNRQQAIAELRTLCAGQHEYSARACRAMEELSSSR